MRKKFTFLCCSALFLLSVPIAAEVPIGKPVSWSTDDGVELKGLFQAPKSSARPVWVLLHGLGSNKQEWLGFARRLAEVGDGFLIYDARGHGESTHGDSDQLLDYKQFRTQGPGSPWDQMSSDLGSAVQFLKSRFSLTGRRIAVGGASLGANVALVYASQRPEVPAVILLSPGLDYAGVKSEEAFRRFGNRPIFLAASPGDKYAYSTVQKLVVQCPGANCTTLQGDGAAHGVDMLNDTLTTSLPQLGLES